MALLYARDCLAFWWLVSRQSISRLGEADANAESTGRVGVGWGESGSGHVIDV